MIKNQVLAISLLDFPLMGEGTGRISTEVKGKMAKRRIVTRTSVTKSVC